MRRGGPVRQAALIGLALTAAACGSTVQTTDSALSAGSGLAPTNGGLGAPATAGVAGGQLPGAPDGALRGPGTPPVAAGGALAATNGNTSSGVEAGSVHRDAAGIPQGFGVAATTISIGVGYSTNGDAANAALGADKITQGDTKGETKAVIDDINRHGGLAGRKLVPVWHAWDAQSAETSAQQDQAACADYTQDHKVFAVLDSGLSDDLAACLRKKGVLQIFAGDIIDHDRQYFREFPTYYDIGTMTQDRMMAAEVPSLVRQRYFTGWDATLGAPAPSNPVKLGILSLDTPSWNRPLDKVLLPALTRAGQHVDARDIVRATYPKSSSDDGALVADIQGAALRFRNDGVTHVILLDPSGSLTLFFSKNAKGQHYYPRYGANSGTGMQALVDAGVVDADQLNGAVGLGWLPNLDLPARVSPKYGTSATKHCLNVMSNAGFTFDSTNAASIALSDCHTLYILQTAINKAGQSITLRTVQTSLDGLGDSFIPAGLPAMRLSPAQHDGATLAYDMTWDNNCGCAAYVGAARRVP